MAKKKIGNILDSSTEELKNIGKKIMQKAEVVNKPVSTPTKPKDEGRDKALYVSPSKHQEARVQAAKRNMKIKEYITFLIDSDKENL